MPQLDILHDTVKQALIKSSKMAEIAQCAAGVPKEDIAFHSPDKRKYTEFAVA